MTEGHFGPLPSGDTTDTNRGNIHVDPQIYGGSVSGAAVSGGTIDGATISGGAGYLPSVAVIDFSPGDITDVPDNADGINLWHDWPNATVSQTVTTMDTKTVLVDVSMFIVIQEPDNVFYFRTAISLDNSSTWTYGDRTWMKQPAGTGAYRYNLSARQALSGVVDTNVVVKAQYHFDLAGPADIMDAHVIGHVLEVAS